MAKAFGKRTEIYLSDKCVSKLAERLYAVLKTSIRCRVQILTKHIKPLCKDASILKITRVIHDSITDVAVIEATIRVSDIMNRLVSSVVKYLFCTQGSLFRL